MCFRENERNSVFRLVSFAAAVCVLLARVPAIGQSTYGTIIGTVTDPSGAVIADAKVDIQDQATGVARSMLTDATGIYRFLNLDAGTYVITVSAINFASKKSSAVILLARETVRSDFQLPLAQETTEVTALADQEIVPETLTMSSSQSGDDINSLALNFRATANPSPIVVANLAPGVQSDSSGNLTVSGQLPTATSFSLDGISTQLPRYGGPTKDLFPSVENIKEFRVNTAANSAEFSQPTDLTVISRSGTGDSTTPPDCRMTQENNCVSFE